jgi:phosphoribosyl 1,2-cyclic phosphate phosphodiesterase
MERPTAKRSPAGSIGFTERLQAGRNPSEGATMNQRHVARILGTGAGDYHLPGGPQPGSPADSPTVKAWNLGGKDIRRSPGLFIAPGILVELGECTAAQLAAYGIAEQDLRHLVVSHGHYDHFYPDKVLDFTERQPAPLRIYGNSMIRDALEFAAGNRWDNVTKEFVPQDRARNYEVQTVTPETPFTLGQVTVTPVLSSHFINKDYCIQEQQALNYVFERGGRTLFYNLDSSWLLPRTLEFLSRYCFDIAILDATWCDLTGFDIKDSGHHNFVMLEKTLASFRARGMLKDDALIIYSHLSTNTVGPHAETAARLAQQGITLGYDGMVFDF